MLRLSAPSRRDWRSGLSPAARSRRGCFLSLRERIAAVPAAVQCGLCTATTALLGLAVLALAGPAQAQTVTTYVGNLAQSASETIRLNSPNRMAQNFTTGTVTGGYALGSVEVRVTGTLAFSASVCTVDTNGFPTTTCTALAPPDNFTAGVVAFSAPSNTTLEADETYAVVLDPPDVGGAVLSLTSSDDEDAGSAAGWSIADTRSYYAGFWDNYAGNGQLSGDLRYLIAVKGLAPPSAPLSFTATPGIEKVDLSWAAPTGHFGAAVTGYEYRHAEGSMVPSATDWAALADGDDAGSSAADETGVTLSGLTNGTAYAFEVRAVNSAGKGTVAGPATATPVANAAPTASKRTVTTTEDIAYVFAERDFSFADANPADTLASVTVVALPGLGELALDGTAVTPGGVVSKADIDASKLVFTPAVNAHGDPYTSFTFKVSDGTVESASAYTMTIDVTASNDAATGKPSISGTAREGQTLMASESDIVDIDGLTGVTYDWQWVRVDADGTSNPVDIAGATSATYRLTSDDVGKRVKVKASFTDADGTVEGPLTSDAYPTGGSVADNTAPTGSSGTVTANEDTMYAFDAADFGFSDSDSGDTLAGVTVVTLPGAGTLRLGATAVSTGQSVTRADIDADRLTFTAAMGATGDAYANFTFKVSDGIDASASTYTITIDVQPGPPCHDPDLTGRRTFWSGTMTVGRQITGSGIVLSGYWESDQAIGSMTDTALRIGTRQFTVDQVLEVVDTRTIDLRFGLDRTDLTGIRTRDLTLHVCSQEFAFKDAERVFLSYQWAAAALGFSPGAMPRLAISAPVNRPATGAPTVSGTLEVNQTVRADPADIADADGIGNLDYQWIRVDGEDETEISRATSRNYKVTTADSGKMLKVRVSFEDRLGTIESRTSAATATVVGDSTGPALSSARVDRTKLELIWNERLDRGSTPAPGDFTVTVDGETVTVTQVFVGNFGVTLTLAAMALRGETVTLDYAPSSNPIVDKAGNEAESLSDRAVVNNTPVDQPPAGQPTISGTARSGEALSTVTSGISDPDGNPDGFTYQWIRIAGGSETEIEDATGRSYTVTPADVGSKLKVRVRFTDALGFPGELTSAETASVPDTVAPELAMAVVTGTELVLTWNEPLDAASEPAASAFAVTVSSSTVTVTTVAVSGDMVTLTLASAAARGDTVTFSYTAPGDSPLQDAIGNDAGNLSNEAVLDGAVVAPGAPTRISAFGTGDTEFLVNWSAPGDNGGAPITGYEYRFAPGSTVPEATPWIQTASTTLFLDETDGVRSGTAYAFEVRAVNRIGAGEPASETVSTGGDTDHPATGSVSITGTVRVRETLTATRNSIADLNGVTKAEAGTGDNAFVYQWILVEDGVETEIDGATSSTFVPHKADAGKQIRVRVSFKDDDDNPEMLTSAAATIEAAPNAAPTSADKTIEIQEDTRYVFGTDDFAFTDADAGENLQSVVAVTMPPEGTLTFNTRAVRPGRRMPEENISNGYLVYIPPTNGNGDALASFTFRVSDGIGDSVDAYTLTIDVTPVNDAAGGAPTIGGAAKVGETVSASTLAIREHDGRTKADAGESGHAYNYQWIRSDSGVDSDISGAMSQSYTLVAADQGKQVRVKVSFTDDGGTDETVTSAPWPGGGTVAAAGAVVAPGSPRNLTAIPAGSGAVTLAWTAPSSNGGAAVTGYEYRHAAGITVPSATSWTVVTDGDDAGESAADETGVTVRGLAYGRVRAFEVRAVNSAGKGSGAGPVTATPVAGNTAPTSEHKTVATAEDTAYTFGAGDFAFADADTGDALASVTVVTLPVEGKLTLDGAAVTADQAVAADALGNLVFTPAPNGNGTGYASFTFKVSDGVSESAAYTLTIDVTAVNDAQAATLVSNIGQTNISTNYPVNSSTSYAQQFTTGTDTGGYTLSEVVVNIKTGAVATPAFSIHTSSDANRPDTNVVDLTGSVSSAGEQSFVPASVTTLRPSTKYFVMFSRSSGDSFHLQATTSEAEDAGAAAGWNITNGFLRLRRGTWRSYDRSMEIAIKGSAATANAAPASADKTVTTNEDTAYTFQVSDFAFTDTDTGDALVSVTVAMLPVEGELALDGTDVTAADVVSKTDIDDSKLVFTPAANENGTPYTTFTFRVNDGTAESASAYTLTVTVTALNDAATGQPSITGTATVGRTLMAATSGIADIDGKMKAEAGDAGFAYTYQWVRVDGDDETDISGATSDSYVLAADDNGKKVKVKVRFTDDGDTAEGPLTSAAYPSGDTVGTNTAPASADKTVTTNEDTAYTFQVSDFAFTDTDSSDALVSVTVAMLPGAGELALDGAPVTADQAVAADALGNLVFTPAPNGNGTGYASFTFKVSDGVSESVTYTMTINVTALNDAATGQPSITGTATVGRTLMAATSGIADIDGKMKAEAGDAGFAYTYQWVRVDGDDETDISGATSDSYVLAADDNGKQVKVKVSFTDDGDTDEGPLTSAAYPSGTTVGTNAAPTSEHKTVTTAEDTAYTFQVSDFAFTDTDTGDALVSVTVVTLPGAGKLTLDGAPVTADQAVAADALGNLVFTPAPNGNGTGYASFTFKVSDGATESAAYTLTINVTALNDAATGQPSITGTATVGRTLMAATSGIADIDGKMKAEAGDTGFAYTYQWVRVDGDDETDISGATSDSYVLAADDNGKQVKVKVRFTDDGDTAEGPLTSAAYPSGDTVGTNAAPASADKTVTTNEDTAYTFQVSDFAFTDTDTGDALVSVTVAMLPGAGKLALDGTAVTTDQAVAADALGNLVFTPAPNGNGTGYASFTFKVSDGVSESVTYTLTIDVTALNDAATGQPSITGTATVGRTLMAATSGIADIDGKMKAEAGDAGFAYTYQWVRVDGDDEMDISGATSDSYVLAADDNGKQVKVKVRFTDDGDTAEGPLTSAAYPSGTTVGTNAAPTSEHKTVTTAEDTAYTFQVSDFAFTDTDSSDALVSVTVAMLPGAGKLTLDGAPVAVDQAVAADALGNLVFTPAPNGNGTGYASFTFKVSDGATESAAYTLTIDVTALNDAATGQPVDYGDGDGGPDADGGDVGDCGYRRQDEGRGRGCGFRVHLPVGAGGRGRRDGHLRGDVGQLRAGRRRQRQEGEGQGEFHRRRGHGRGAVDQRRLSVGHDGGDERGADVRAQDGDDGGGHGVHVPGIGLRLHRHGQRGRAGEREGGGAARRGQACAQRHGCDGGRRGGGGLPRRSGVHAGGERERDRLCELHVQGERRGIRERDVHDDHQRDGAERCGDGQAFAFRHGAGGADADGVDVGYCGRGRRAGHPGLPVGSGGRGRRDGHHGRDLEHLHAGRCGQRQEGEGEGALH